MIVDDLDASIRYALPGATMLNMGFRKGPDGKLKKKLRPEPQTDEAFMQLLQGTDEGHGSGVCGAGKAFQSPPKGSKLAPHDRTRPWWAQYWGEMAEPALEIHRGPDVEKKAAKVEKALRKHVSAFKQVRAQCESWVNEQESVLIGSVMEWEREEQKGNFVTPDYDSRRAAVCESTCGGKNKTKKPKKKKKKKKKKGEL